MDYINKYTGQVAEESGEGFFIWYYGAGILAQMGMSIPAGIADTINNNPDWEPLPKLGDDIKELLNKH